ncbi:MAG: DUF192 domain-containing protein [Planctomycetota bacterium]
MIDTNPRDCFRRPWAGLALLTALLAIATACGSSVGSSGSSAAIPATVPIDIKGQTFHLEMALTPDQQFQGLSDRAEIAGDGGMIFVFASAKRRAFVMRRCLVPIDIAFVSPTGSVTAVHAMQVVPYDTPEFRLKPYRSRYPAQYAIEVAGGTWERIGLEAGDQLDLPAEKLKAWREKADAEQ